MHDDPRPPELRWRDLIVSVAFLTCGLLMAFGLVQPAEVLEVLEHEAWSLIFVALGGGTGAGLFAYLEHRHGRQAAEKFREVEQGVKTGRDAVLELARKKKAGAPLSDGRVVREIGSDDVTPIVDVDKPGRLG